MHRICVPLAGPTGLFGDGGAWTERGCPLAFSRSGSRCCPVAGRASGDQGDRHRYGEYRLWAVDAFRKSRDAVRARNSGVGKCRQSGRITRQWFLGLGISHENRRWQRRSLADHCRRSRPVVSVPAGTMCRSSHTHRALSRSRACVTAQDWTLVCCNVNLFGYSTCSASAANLFRRRYRHRMNPTLVALWTRTCSRPPRSTGILQGPFDGTMDHMGSPTANHNSSSRVVLASVFAISLWFVNGCARAPVPDYALSEATQASSGATSATDRKRLDGVFWYTAGPAIDDNCRRGG